MKRYTRPAVIKTWLILLAAVIASACGGGTPVSLPTLWRIPVVSNTITLTTLDSGTSYNAAQVTPSSGLVSLTALYQTLYDFNTNTSQGWSTYLTLDGGGFVSGPDYSGGTLAYQSDTNGWHGLANLTSSILGDYIQVSEFTPVALDPIDLAAQCMRAQSGADQQYMFGMWTNTEYIYKRNGSFTNIGSGAGLAMTAGTTYMIKTYAVGTALKMRVWQKGTAEPGAWAATASDTSYSTGYPCLDFYSQQHAYYDNIRIGSSTYTNDYVMTNPTFQFKSAQLSGRVVASVSATVVAGSTDSVVFDVSIDGGSTYLTWNGSAWVTNSSGYSGGISLSTLSSNISSLPTAQTLIIRAYLHSTYGYSTPTLSDLVLTLQ